MTSINAEILLNSWDDGVQSDKPPRQAFDIEDVEQ